MSQGYNSSKYVGKYLIYGHNLINDINSNFINKVNISYYNLDEWCNTTCLEPKIVDDVFASFPKFSLLKLNPLTNSEYEIGFDYSSFIYSRFSYNEVKINRYNSIYIKYFKLASFSQVINHVVSIQNVLNLIQNKLSPVRILSIEVDNKKSEILMPNLLTSNIERWFQKSFLIRLPDIHEILFSIIAESIFINQDYKKEFSEIVSILNATMYLDNSFIENIFLNTIHALELMDCILTNNSPSINDDIFDQINEKLKNAYKEIFIDNYKPYLEKANSIKTMLRQYSLKERLVRLITDTFFIVYIKDNNINKFVKKIVDYRNSLSHPAINTNIIKDYDRNYVTTFLQYLLLYKILLKFGLEKEIVEKNMKWLIDRDVYDFKYIKDI